MIGRNAGQAAFAAAISMLLAGCGAGDRLAPIVKDGGRAAASPIAEPASHGDPVQLVPGVEMVLFVVKGGPLKQGERVDVAIYDQNEDPDFGGGDRWTGAALARLGEPAPNHRGGVGRAPVDGDPPADAHREFSFGLADYSPGGGGEVGGGALVVRSHRGKVEVYVPAGFVEREFRQGRVEFSVTRGTFPNLEVVRTVELSYEEPPARAPLPIVECLWVYSGGPTIFSVATCDDFTP